MEKINDQKTKLIIPIYHRNSMVNRNINFDSKKN